MKYLQSFNEAKTKDEEIQSVLDTIVDLMEKNGFRFGVPKDDNEYLSQEPYYEGRQSVVFGWQVNIVNIPDGSNGLSRMYDKVMDLHNSMERRTGLSLDVKTSKSYSTPGSITIKKCSGDGCGQYHRKDRLANKKQLI